MIDLLPAPIKDTVLADLFLRQNDWVNGLPAPYGDEIRGISKATGIELGLVFLFNIAYELEGGCTSIVAQNQVRKKRQQGLVDGLPNDANSLSLSLSLSLSFLFSSSFLFFSFLLQNGQLFHARNLDFGLFLGWDKLNHTWALTEKLRPLLFNARVMKGGVNIYNATYFAGRR